MLGDCELAFDDRSRSRSRRNRSRAKGGQFFLQTDMGTVVTRETRRSRSASVPWDRPVEPAILMIAAMPEGMDVPVEDHVDALRAAVKLSGYNGPRKASRMNISPGRPKKTRPTNQNLTDCPTSKSACAC